MGASLGSIVADLQFGCTVDRLSVCDRIGNSGPNWNRYRIAMVWPAGLPS